jgi:type II secretory pathway pseudopilin PulG
MRSSRGASLPELLTVLAILGAMAATALPSLLDVLAQSSLSSACNDVMAVFTQARARATFHGCDVGVKWVSSGGDIVLSIYEDRNGNGVTAADIKKGIDKLVGGPYWFRGRYPGITFSFLPGFEGLDPSGDPIGDLSDAIRFGRSDIATFSPTGNASPGSVYLSNGKHRQAVVRVSPATARIQIFDWMGKKQKWVKRW